MARLAAFQLPQQSGWQKTTSGFARSPPVSFDSQPRYQSSCGGESAPAPAPGSQALPGIVRCGGGTHASAATLSGLCGIGPTSTSTGSCSEISAASSAVSMSVPPAMVAGTGPPIGPVQKPAGSGAASRSDVGVQAESSNAANMNKNLPPPS